MAMLAKPSRTARKLKERKDRADRKTAERTSKTAAKKRDGRGCRFPLCGCHAMGWKPESRPESSHDKHKGMGGNPRGDRSKSELLITLCRHRHQDGAVSRHKGTLRTRYLTEKANDGPVAWDVHADAIASLWPGGWLLGMQATDGWVEVAREIKVGQVGPLESWQRALLTTLAKMEDY